MVAEDSSVMKNNPKVVGSEEAHGLEEAHGSEEVHGSEELYGPEKDSYESDWEEEWDSSEEEDDGSEEDSDEDSDGSEEKSIVKPVTNAEPEKPQFSYRPGDWESVFQVCEVKVLKSAGCKNKKSEQIYGSINLCSEHGVWKLYDRRKEDAETIDVTGFITVTPPPFGISPFHPLWIRFAMEGGLKGMNRTYVDWLPIDPFNRFKAIRVRGSNCAMEVSFIAFGTAVLADMEINLLNMPNEEEIYGRITATFSEKPGVRPLFMFNKKAADCVCVKEKEPVPLSRPFIAVPFGNDLEINVDLRTVSGAAVAQGTISIFPERLGRWSGVLGTHDQIQVRATVLVCPYDKHSATVAAPELYGFLKRDEL